ncbi:MAG: hypothetical protein MUP69_05625 [Candidatus Atribacteria bacterium]|nr:hypothetical protein [Candidatus Atribacteria bacterium]
MDCDFSTPVNYQNETPLEGEPFAFSEMSCIDDKFLQYNNTYNGASFYLQKSISFGDVLVIFFLIFFFTAFVFKLIWNFVFKDWNAKL